MLRVDRRLFRIVTGLFLLALFGCLGCASGPTSSNGDGLTSDDSPPNVDIDLEILQLLPHCPYWYRLTYDATGSTDNVTSGDDLEVRWDRENDGDWDTNWQSVVAPDYTYTPEMNDLLAIDTLWTVRCEVRDEAQNVSEHVEGFPIGPLPVAPDLIPTRVQIKVGADAESDVDTVHVDEQFQLGHTFVCWGALVGQQHEIHYLIDGEVVEECSRDCSDGLCVGTACGYYILDELGQHTVTVILDPEDLIAESDETNNSLTETLAVVPLSRPHGTQGAGDSGVGAER